MPVIPENESAFAVYSGVLSSKAGKKKKKKKVKENKALDISLNKREKLDIIRKKKEKKKNILMKSSGESLPDSTPKKHKKNLPTLENANIGQKNIQKKKKKKPADKKLGKQLSTNGIVSKFDLNIQSQNLSDTAASIAPDFIQPINTTYCVGSKPEKEKKTKKKVQIISDLPSTGNEGFKKVVVSTPRFKKKVSSIAPPETSTNSLLTMAQSYVKKKQTNEVRVPEQGESSSSILQKIAGEAKIIVEKQGSKEAFGESTLQKILEPFNVKSFLRDYWEKKPLHVPGRENKFASFISTEMIDSVLRDNIVLFGKHLDVTSYTNGERETHNPEGRAHAHIVWDFYSNGCSVRLLNPQYFMNTIHILNAHLQELFGCFVGANVYLTPPNTQGFAPHFDDIEAIILQVEGSKIWKIYAPMNKDGYLPRFSSRNLTDEEIGEPIMEITLKPGDVLYFPRGFIHQARTEDKHSLHITLSTYQQTSWFDYLEKLLPLTLKKASSNDVEFRKGMPIGYLESAGLAYKNSANQNRKLLLENLKMLMKKLTDFLEVDSAMDELGLKYIQEALPPVLTPREAACSIVADGWRMGKNGQLSHQIEFSLDTCVRWIRNYCFRIVEENETLENGSIEKQTRIYYTLENSREYRKEEPQFIIVPPEMVAAVLHLASAYPKYSKISDLPAENDDIKIMLVGDLWDHGLLMTDKPLTTPYSEDEVMKESPLSKEEEEVIADLMDAVHHGIDAEENANESDEADTCPDLIMSTTNDNAETLASVNPEESEEDHPLESSESEDENITME